MSLTQEEADRLAVWSFVAALAWPLSGMLRMLPIRGGGAAIMSYGLLLALAAPVIAIRLAARVRRSAARTPVLATLGRVIGWIELSITLLLGIGFLFFVLTFARSDWTF